jgi:hypothetical protein
VQHRSGANYYFLHYGFRESGNTRSILLSGTNHIKATKTYIAPAIHWCKNADGMAIK